MLAKKVLAIIVFCAMVVGGLFPAVIGSDGPAQELDTFDVIRLQGGGPSLSTVTKDYTFEVPGYLYATAFTYPDAKLPGLKIELFDVSDGGPVLLSSERIKFDRETLSLESSHVYVAPGKYSMTFTPAGGGPNRMATVTTWFSAAINYSPVAVMSITPSPAYTDMMVTFDGSGSYDPDGTVVDWMWDFGDGMTDSGEVVYHAYGVPGMYTVTLTVYDELGADNSATEVLEVLTNEKPVAVIVADKTTAMVGEMITLDGTQSYDPDGTIASYAWNLGDGTTDSSDIVMKSYGMPGTYVVTLVVTDNLGALSDPVSVTLTIEAPPEPPVAVIAGPSTGNQGVELTFDGSGSYDPDGMIMSWDWDFGDGAIASGTVVTHAFDDG
ncbi:MAG TPA: PKD domain-containing protein, partial [Euryarchaeota archaeon]|nr:PKD domain-containing protein [Euryarchaeota archaeon]